MTSLKKLIIVGAGEHGKVASNILKNQYQISGYLDRNLKLPGVLGDIKSYKSYLKNHYFFVAIGNNTTRYKFYLMLKNSGARFVNAIHDTAIVDNDVHLGDNVFIGAMSYVNIGSWIGNNSHINNKCLIEHDNQIGEHCHLTPGVITGGGVAIGDHSFIGLGAVINDHLKIGERVIIGSGAVVIDNIPSDSVAVGVPAKVKEINGEYVKALGIIKKNKI